MNFVIDKLKFVGLNIKAILPKSVVRQVKKQNRSHPFSKGNKASLLLHDVELYYSNFLTLCNIDSTWACEEGLKAFNQHCEFILETNLVNQTKLNSLTHHMTNN